MPIEFAKIRGLVKLAKGAQATVYKVPPGALPVNTKEAVAVKKYSAELIQGNEAAIELHLNMLIARRQAVPDGVRETIDRFTTWPKMVIYENHMACGYAMRLIPDVFFTQYNDAPGPQIAESTLDFVYNDDRTRVSLGLPLLSVTGRAKIVYDFLRAVAGLHSEQIVLGDLSPRNVLVYVDAARQSRNRALFIDADSFRKTGSTHPFRQPHTFNWFPPESWAARQERIRLSKAGGSRRDIDRLIIKEFAQNFQTDVYKISLAILRLYYEGDRRTTITRSDSAIARLGKEVGREFAALVERGLSEEPARRPTAQQMLSCLENMVRK